MHHLLSVATYVLDEGKSLHAGEMQTENVAEVSEDEEVAEATLHEDTRSMGHNNTNPNLICPARVAHMRLIPPSP